MYRKKWVLISLAIVFFSAGLIYGVLSYYYGRAPAAPPAQEKSTQSDLSGGSEELPEGVSAGEADAKGPLEAREQPIPSGAGKEPPASYSRYVGVEGGYVAIFLGNPGRGKVERLTEIPVDSLPRFEQENLRKGIEVKSREELSQILEGLSGS